MTTDRIWILGASDPEMTAIERLLTDVGEEIAYATVDGVRVHPGNAYMADAVEGTHFIECEPSTGYPPGAVIIDHHRPGDPGYGRPPSEFLAASSIGQVVAMLAARNTLPWSYDLSEYDSSPGNLMIRRDKWAVADSYGDPVTWYDMPIDIVYAAAADHCLGAAYQGECPGVDPDELMQWRTTQRAAFQGRSVEEIMADVQAAMAELRAAPRLAECSNCCCSTDGHSAPQDEGCPDPCTGHPLRDMRRNTPVPELPEAACRLGMGYVAGPLVGPDGREKITCSGEHWQVKWFLESWAPTHGLTGLYGDPARGFAGGYLT